MRKSVSIKAVSLFSLLLGAACSDVEDPANPRDLDLAELEELQEGSIELYPGVLREAHPGGAVWTITGSEAHLWLRARLIEQAELEDEPERAAQRETMIADLTVATLNMADAPREDDVTFRAKTLSACVYAVYDDYNTPGWLAKAAGERTGFDFGNVCVDTEVQINTSVQDPSLQTQWDKASQQAMAYAQNGLSNCYGYAWSSAGNQSKVAEVFTCPPYLFQPYATACVGNCCPTSPPPPGGGVGDGGGIEPEILEMY